MIPRAARSRPGPLAERSGNHSQCAAATPGADQTPAGPEGACRSPTARASARAAGETGRGPPAAVGVRAYEVVSINLFDPPEPLGRGTAPRHTVIMAYARSWAWKGLAKDYPIGPLLICQGLEVDKFGLSAAWMVRYGPRLGFDGEKIKPSQQESSLRLQLSLRRPLFKGTVE